MGKISKKILSSMAAITILAGSGIMLNACSCTPDDSSKVMNLSLNPSIEFVLDKNDKVVTVNALNDEGNYIIANVDFSGLTAEKAAEKFLEATKESGYIVEGSNDDEKLEISISGEAADDLFNEVKASANKYLEEIDVDLSIKLDEVLDKDYLKSLVADCMQELTPEDINEMSEEELIEAIQESREETKDFLSQDLKEMYYTARADEIIKQKYNKILELVQGNSLLSLIATPLSGAVNTAIGCMDTVRQKYNDYFLKSDSAYQQAMTNFMAAKKSLLETKLQGVDTTTIEANLTIVEGNLTSAKNAALGFIETAETALTTALASIETILTQCSEFIGQSTAAIDTAMNTAKESYLETFKTQNATYTADNYWETYWSALEPTTTA